MPKHDYKCENCGKPATRLFEMSWTISAIDKDGQFGETVLDEPVDDSQHFYCDEHES